MARPRIGRMTQINGKIVFYRMYKEMGTAGSWEKVASWYSNVYGNNPETGKPFTRMAMLNSAWRWAIKANNENDFEHDNLEEAKEIYRNFWLQWGEPILYDDPAGGVLEGDAAWKQLISDKVNSLIASNKHRKEWFKYHPEYIVIPKV